MANQKVDLSLKRALAALGNNSSEESGGEVLENQSFVAIEGLEKYDFLTLVVIMESNNGSSKDKAVTIIKAEPDYLGIKARCDENVELMSKAGSYDEYSTLLDTKVSSK